MPARLLSRCLALTGAMTLAGGIALQAGAGGATAAPAPTREPSIRELLGGKDGKPVRRIEGSQDRASIDAQLGAAHAAPPGQAVSARLAAARQAAGLPTAAGDGLGGTWKSAHDVFRADDPRFGVDDLGWEELGGRTISLAVDTRDKTGETIWAGSAGGGVWRSTDGGTSWTPTFDDQPSMAIGAVAISPTTGWVYAGTGEANTNGDGLSGTGVYRSKDAGDTWERVTANTRQASTTFHVAISRAPGAAADTVFVATNMGLFVSPDGGDSYADVKLPTNAAGTAPYTATAFGNFVTDVRVAPDDPTQVTAAVGWRRGKGVDAFGVPQSVGNGLYRSTEGGAVGTWRRLTTNLGSTGAPGLSDDPLGRISLAYASGKGQNPNILWAVVQDAGLFNNETFLGTPLPAKPSVLAGVYVSMDDGATFTLKATPASFGAAPGTSILPLLALQSGPGVQAWYDQYVEVDPVDQNRVIIGLEEIYSTVGNPYLPAVPAAFKTIGRYWNTCILVASCEGAPTYEGKTTHPDQHAAAFALTPDGVRLYTSGDGGVFGQNADPVLTPENPAGGYDNQSWEFLNVGLTTTQPLYAVIGGDGTIYAGQQDNGTLKVEPGSRTAHLLLGGDGIDVAVDPKNSDIAFGSTQNGAISSTTDGGQTYTSEPSGVTNPLFYAPFEMDPKDPLHVVTGGRQIAEKTDGASGEGFTVSFDLGFNARNTTVVNQTSAVDVLGPAVYAGFCGQCDIVTAGRGDPLSFQNGLATNVRDGCEPTPGTPDCWSIVPARGLPNRYITDVEIDPADPETVYVTLGGYGRRWFLPSKSTPGVGDGNIFVSTDAGKTFTNLSGTGAARLPDVPANAVVVRDGQLVVGNDVGVFTAPVAGGSWARLGKGLPNVATFDVNLDPSGRKMVAATHGRSVWTYDFGAASVTAPRPVPGSSGGPVAAPRRDGGLAATGGLPLSVLGGLLLVAAFAVRRRTA